MLVALDFWGPGEFFNAAFSADCDSHAAGHLRLVANCLGLTTLPSSQIVQAGWPATGLLLAPLVLPQVPQRLC